MLLYQLYGIFENELEFFIRMKVLHTLQLIKSKIENRYQKSSFMRKPKFINVLFS